MPLYRTLPLSSIYRVRVLRGLLGNEGYGYRKCQCCRDIWRCGFGWYGRLGMGIFQAWSRDAADRLYSGCGCCAFVCLGAACSVDGRPDAPRALRCFVGVFPKRPRDFPHPYRKRAAKFGVPPFDSGLTTDRHPYPAIMRLYEGRDAVAQSPKMGYAYPQSSRSR